MSRLSDTLKAAIESGLRVREIISEPDGTHRVLTDLPTATPMRDALSEARERRAAKVIGHVDGHKKAG